jgi:acetyl-CoA synthetase
MSGAGIDACRHDVSVWHTAPTAIRVLAKADRCGEDASLSSSLIASVGEPLNPEAVVWGVEAFGLPVHDTWWQTETGAIMIANFISETVWPGSMGLAMPGVQIEIARRREDGSVELLGPDEVGEIVLKPDWPSMFQTYLNNEQRYRESFADGWYFSGDQARRDKVTSGSSAAATTSSNPSHLISPFGQCALNLHPAVMQSAVLICGSVGVSRNRGETRKTADAESVIRHCAWTRCSSCDRPRISTSPRYRARAAGYALLRARARLPGDLSTLEPTHEHTADTQT